MRAKRERSDAPGRLPFREAAAQIGLDAGGGLVAFLHGLREQLHHDGRDGVGDRCKPLMRRHGLTRDMAVDQLHGIGRREGRRAREHFIEGGAQGVEVAAGIDRPVHSPGLFRRHIGERAGDHLRRLGALLLARQAGGDSETGEADAVPVLTHQNVGRLDIFMDEPARVHPTARGRERDRDMKEMRRVQRLARASDRGAARPDPRGRVQFDPDNGKARSVAPPNASSSAVRNAYSC